MSAAEHLNKQQFMGLDELKASRSNDFGGTVGEMKDKWLASPRHPDNQMEPQAYVDHLANSISREGVREPLEFVANKDYEGNTYQLLMNGHHRALAAIQAGVDKVPVTKHPDFSSYFGN